jgi:3-deoxy-D-manno-octulosonate 8-phosphate phosphatase (KDO 8-P phosphatase)
MGYVLFILMTGNKYHFIHPHTNVLFAFTLKTKVFKILYKYFIFFESNGLMFWMVRGLNAIIPIPGPVRYEGRTIKNMNDDQRDKAENLGTASRRGRGDAEILRRLSKVKLLSLDVDGVLTDGGLYYTDDGRIQRKYNVKDGVGIKRALEAGIHIVIISAAASGSIPERAATLGIEHVFTSVEDKMEVLETLCGELGIEMSETAHIGDDLNDVALLEAVGCPIAVADAQPEAWAAALIITERNGGAGAVREICDALVESRPRAPDD